MLALLGLLGVVVALAGSLLLVWRGYRAATGNGADPVGPAQLLVSGAVGLVIAGRRQLRKK